MSNLRIKGEKIRCISRKISNKDSFIKLENTEQSKSSSKEDQQKLRSLESGEF